MNEIRIAVLNPHDRVLAFLDNTHRNSMHYWNDELHEYLQGTANTYAFTVSSKHEDAAYIVEGNKVAFVYNGKDYYLNIVHVEKDEFTVTATAWSLSFELINENVGAYKSESAMSFEEYVTAFDPERTVRIGINEVSDKRISNEWTGEATVLSRLFSVANVFDAEIEFQTVLNDDYSLKEIVMNVYREHSDNNTGVGEFRGDIKLRYGKNVTGIRKESSIENLYTGIRPTGKDGLTIQGIEKEELDENGVVEFYTQGPDIRAPQARDRFPSNLINKEDGYIFMPKSYDTDNKDKLYSMALSDLKTASEPAVTYDVTGYFDTAIGDTVEIEDEEYVPTLYLSARVSEQVRSFTNPQANKTVFTNFKELQSEISEDLLQKVEDLINKTKIYTCSIATNNGIIFKNGIGSTTLTAYAYNNGVDVSGNLEIRWSKDGTEFYVGKSVTVNAEDVDVKAVYSFTAYENGVKRGYYEVTVTDVSDGEPGKDGTTYYTWFKFADDEYGNGMSSSPDGKEYLGIAYNKETPVMSNNPEDYQWARITGEGVPGKPGDDGKTYYTWVRYADDASGNGMSDSPNGKYYIGFAYNKEVPTESSNPTDYQWSKYKGDDGQDGVGIESITKYYLASEKSTGITISSSGWSTTKQDMTDVKKYLWSYEVYAYTNGTSTKTTPIIIGVHGQNGADGDSGIIVSPTAPENPKAGQLWQTASGEPIKRWDGSKWVIYYISVENLNVEALSAIAANLGTVTAGLIKSLDGHFFIQVNTGEIYSEDENGINSSAISKGVFMANGMNNGRHTSLSIFPTQIAQYFDGATISNLVNFKRDGIYIKSTGSYEVNISKATNYDSGRVSGPYISTNSQNYARVELKRRGCVVTCRLTMLAQFPSQGNHGPFDEIQIPAGYQPSIDITEPCNEVVGTSIFGSGRYHISKGGEISLIVDNPAYCEHTRTFTWITDD
ncbi:phage tail spike protein [Mediterraneibacter gnavus]|uniref:phage tail spike protein n=1 Tax=Mediterraneibacter gnavus TaxID=33038 RepID=UPI0032B8081D